MSQAKLLRVEGLAWDKSKSRAPTILLVEAACNIGLDIKIYTKMATEAYCVKCRSKRMMKDEKEVSMPGKGGQRRAMTGFCTVCGTKMFRILGKK
ncbi:MAG: hypothetical protein HYW89_03760 [Candidatus Sungiibacteriota bacterium]|uniref:DUF5679 domain-containing protein n=1 Tax=Candidatus Sungiibacteriota bacterium TaxID=2750080 RepID=A0A7T5RKH7_9BACT|nr:MAG: hypothetical protein HYW89_03760 [Candidatus Sungbacteria bacterium]